MSGKNSFIIIGIVLVILVVFVYKYSTPGRPAHRPHVIGTAATSNADSVARH